ncbi:MAG: 3TM-type holin [Defluviicoccus sp.]|nr:3TM-type holin [Defluviicoccus sp.]
MSSIAADVVGGTIQGVVEGVGEVLDRLFTSDEERAKLALARLEIERLPALKQIEVNLAEAAHPSVFVAGWRPAIGWVCALALVWAFLLQPMATWAISTFALGLTVPAIVSDHLFELVLAMLGMAGLRTFEKTKRR